MTRTTLERIAALALGVVTAWLWHYGNAQVIGYLALSRFPDRWPVALHIGVPVLIFLPIVLVSYWVFLRVFRQSAVIAIWACLITYLVILVQAVFALGAGLFEITLSALLVCAAVLPGIVATRFAGRVMRR